ncbi:hypothetical protein J7L85_04220 [candidate division WOR-3 bacterium]|nr:hypothetical protein [candidate division WOR-3 bacterium]
MRKYKGVAKRNGEVEYEMSNGTKYRMVVYEKDEKLYSICNEYRFMFQKRSLSCTERGLV